MKGLLPNIRSLFAALAGASFFFPSDLSTS
jgi:hypothetical protein